MPRVMRVDNGYPWGSQGDWPTDLALWLIGLGLDMIWNPARTPQDNGVVERSQGTGKRWGEPETCADADELQCRLDKMDRIQREAYPSPEESRWQRYPQLQQKDRPYSKEWEKQNWNLERVLEHMAKAYALRRVDSKGQVSIYGRNHYIGERYRGREIYVFLDPVDREWVFATAEGLQVRRKAAEELVHERILNLQVTNRRD
jgi:transposase InsO family protein